MITRVLYRAYLQLANLLNPAGLLFLIFALLAVGWFTFKPAPAKQASVAERFALGIVQGDGAAMNALSAPGTRPYMLTLDMAARQAAGASPPADYSAPACKTVGTLPHDDLTVAVFDCRGTYYYVWTSKKADGLVVYVE